MPPNRRVISKYRRGLDRLVSWRRTLVLLSVLGALTSLVLVSSAHLEDRGTRKSPERRQPQGQASQSELNQDDTPLAGAMRVEIPSVKAKIFHGDVRRLPLVKPKIKKP